MTNLIHESPKEYQTYREPFMLLVSNCADESSWLLRDLISRGRAAVCTQALAREQLEILVGKDEVVVVVAADATWLHKAAEINRVFAVRVVPDVETSLADNRIISVSSLERLACLFGDSGAHELAWLLGFDAERVRTEQDKRRSTFHAITAAAGGLHIFGTGTVGRQVLQDCHRSGVAVLGFVDNNQARWGGEVDGYRITAPTDLNPDTDVVVVSAGNHADTIANQLSGMAFKNIVNLSHFFYAIEDSRQPECGYLNDLVENRVRWLALALILGDERSRRVLSAVVRHRLTLDISPLATICDKEVPQWFDPQFLIRDPHAVFVDGGAYDGDTAEAFLKANGPARAVHAFELDPEIAQRAALRLSGHSEVVVHALGLSDRRAELGFLRTGITDGRLGGGSEGGTKVQVISIDEAIEDSATFIKLDVEGEESNAIAGACRQIVGNSPLIAVAVYHKPPDPWSIPLQLTQLNPNYCFFMRHYTEVAFETVIYAVPGHTL